MSKTWKSFCDAALILDNNTSHLDTHSVHNMASTILHLKTKVVIEVASVCTDIQQVLSKFRQMLATGWQYFMANNYISSYVATFSGHIIIAMEEGE